MLSLCLVSGDFYPGLGQSCPLESVSRAVRSGSHVLWGAVLPVLRNRSSPEPWSGSTDSKTLDYQRTNPAAAAAAKSRQSCPTLCNPIDSSLPGSPIPGILQARTLEWVAISFSSALKWKVKVKLLSCARLLATPWTAAYQAPPSIGFSRQQYWTGVPLPSPFIC